VRAICLHGHFYQPPREHPWTGVVEPEASAAPYRDWNARITAECYAPNATARVFDGAGRLAALVDTYEWTSFDFGPTLFSWLALHAPEVVSALRRADAAAVARTGFGNAWAQAYGHAILPLSTPRDVRTQVLWGRRDFEARFGRAPEGMWLPEMAVDTASLEALAEAGIGLTMLSPHQVARVRPLGAGDDAWRPVEAATLDTRRLYRCTLSAGRSIDLVFRDHGISHDVAFGPLLADGVVLAARLREATREAAEGSVVAVAVDGETYGHHHRFGEMALAAALRALAADREVALVGPAAFAARHPPTHEVTVVERSSWSCPHGVERWRADCGCRVGGPAGANQAWRAPLRDAIDWLRDALARVFEERAGAVLRDPWGARDRWVECLLDPARTPAFLAAEASGSLSPAGAREARRMLEMARNALFMQTSCGWFFDELAGLEPVQILRYAARAIELAEGFGRRLEDGLCARLEPARTSPHERESGADLYRRAARGEAATPARVAGTLAMLAVAGREGTVPGFEVRFSTAPVACRLEGDAEVRELATDTVTRLGVASSLTPEGPPACRAGDVSLTIADLFGVQREALLEALGREAAATVETAGRDAVGRIRPLLDVLLRDRSILPPALASLLGWEGAGAIVAALESGTEPLPILVRAAAAVRRRGGRFPADWLAGHIARALEARLAALPGTVEEALGLLDLADAADVRIDLGPAQVRAFEWFRTTPGSAVEGHLARLRERLALAPEGA
jgi:alpha-amylase/alpha-mannosidase (GH57 family)